MIDAFLAKLHLNNFHCAALISNKFEYPKVGLIVGPPKANQKIKVGNVKFTIFFNLFFPFFNHLFHIFCVTFTIIIFFHTIFNYIIQLQ